MLKTTITAIALVTAASVASAEGCATVPIMSKDGTTVLYTNFVDPTCPAPAPGTRFINGIQKDR